jgi:urease accessory protein
MDVSNRSISRGARPSPGAARLLASQRRTEKALKSHLPHFLRPARLLPALLLLLLFLAFPLEAHAHSPVKGMGDFINGLLHPLTTPAHILIVVGLGLWLGQRSPLNLKLPMLIFAPLTAAALLLSMTGIVKTVHPPFLIALALAAGTLVAMDKPLPALGTASLFTLAALALGFDSAVENGTTAAILKTLLGTWLSLVLLVVDIAIYVSLCVKKPWQKIGIRILGSWIIAISLLVLAFALRGN